MVINFGKCLAPDLFQLEVACTFIQGRFFVVPPRNDHERIITFVGVNSGDKGLS